MSDTFSSDDFSRYLSHLEATHCATYRRTVPDAAPFIARGTAATIAALPSYVVPVAEARPLFSWRKVGGIYHFRVGRFGGSFYLAKSRRDPRQESGAALYALIGAAMAYSAFLAMA